MTQLLLNITNKKKAAKLIEFLKTLNYISIQEFTDEDIMIPDTEKELIRKRLDKAKEEDFKDWDELKKKFSIK